MVKKENIEVKENMNICDDNFVVNEYSEEIKVTNKNCFYVISESQLMEDCPTVSSDDIIKPKRATKYSAGYDFYAPYDITLMPGTSVKIPTGIKVSLNDNNVLLMVPRSSLGFKYKLKLDNTVGVIDADYYNNPKNEGHIWVSMTNMSPDRVLQVKKGEAFCQGIIVNYCITVDDSVETERIGGMGSTNK